MSLQIATRELAPIRQTFDHIARRLGEDRPATRYQEGMYDLQPTESFHYRPVWDPKHDIYDAKRTRIELEDFYVLLDARQFYYASYNISRAAMDASNRKAFELLDQRGLIQSLPQEWQDLIVSVVVPFRHYEWGANMNNWQIADESFGAAMNSAAAFCAADRLGMAQVIGRIGLHMDGQTGDALDRAKAEWMEGAHLQGLRKLVEDSFVLDDWFEVFFAQDLVMDGIFHPLLFEAFDERLSSNGGFGLSMVHELMRDWFADCSKWVDGITKIVAASSDANKAFMTEWITTWRGRALEAAKPLAEKALGDGAEASLAVIDEKLVARLAKLGVEIAQ